LKHTFSNGCGFTYLIIFLFSFKNPLTHESETTETTVQIFPSTSVQTSYFTYVCAFLFKTNNNIVRNCVTIVINILFIINIFF